jgi:CRISPR-associated endonuclease Cas2
MALLISYDIEHDYLRQKIANYILDAGLARVQYSVYIGTVKEAVAQRLLAWTQSLPSEANWGAQDSFLLLSLTQLQVQQMLVVGNPQWDKDDLSGSRHTLIL